MWQVSKADELGFNTNLSSQGQLLTQPEQDAYHPGPLSPADLLSYLGYGSRFTLGLESSSSKDVPWEPTHFDAFVQSMTKSQMPRIGLVELQNPVEGSNEERRIVAVLWSIDSHPTMWRKMSKLAFESLRRVLPDSLYFTWIWKESDLTAANVYDSSRVNDLGWSGPAPAPAPSVAAISIARSQSQLRGVQTMSTNDVNPGSANATEEEPRVPNIKPSAGVTQMVQDMAFLHSYSWLVFRITSGGDS